MIKSGYKPKMTEISNNLPVLLHKGNSTTENSLEIRLKHITEEYNINSSVITIPIIKVVSLQPTIIKEKVDEMVSKNKNITKPVNIYKINNYYLLIDGNHRANASLLQNNKIINAEVFDIDSNTSDLIKNLIEDIQNNYEIVYYK